MSETTIRRATADDQEDVLALWLALLDDQATLEHRLGAAEDAAKRWRNDFSDWTRDEGRRLFVAERGEGELVAFLSAERWTPPPIYAAPHEVHVNELYVHSDLRRKRVGQQLIEATRAWAGEIGAERLRLEVLIANEEGRAFWQSLGAKPLSQTLTIALGKSADRDASDDEATIGF